MIKEVTKEPRTQPEVLLVSLTSVKVSIHDSPKERLVKMSSMREKRKTISDQKHLDNPHYIYKKNFF